MSTNAVVSFGILGEFRYRDNAAEILGEFCYRDNAAEILGKFCMADFALDFIERLRQRTIRELSFVPRACSYLGSSVRKCIHMNLLRILPVVALLSLEWVVPPATGQSPTMINQPGSRPPLRVVSLPPPPSHSPSPTSQVSTSQVSTPAHVPLKPMVPPTTPKPSTALTSISNNVVGHVASQTPTQNQFSPPALPPLPSTTFSYSPPSATIANSAVRPQQNSQLSPPLPSNQLIALVPTTQPAATVIDVAPQEFPAGRLIAVVGTEHILAGDMAVFVEPIIDQNRSKIGSPEDEQKIRNQLTRQSLRQYCEIKAIYQEFFRDMVGTVPPKELEETKKKVVTRAGKIFFEKQVPTLLKKYKVETLQELERKLNEKSLSLSTLKGQFIEQVLASELERKYVPDKFEVDRQDLLNAYQQPANQDRWKVAGRVRWRQLTVRFDKHPTRAEADAKIRELGDEIFLGGKAFDAVARQSSEGYTASEGGRYDWTTQGSLKSKEIDQAIFTLPLNSLSQVIVDEIGLHIVEVLAREPGRVRDFTEAQAELREELSDERRNKEVREFRKRIMDRTTVWTLWPEDIPGSRPLTEALGDLAN